MLTQLWPSVIDVEHVAFWVLLVLAISCALACAYYMLDFFVGPYVADGYASSEARRKELDRVIVERFQ